MIQPILLYGSELWGFEASKCIENIHLKFCKRMLNIKQNTPEPAVLGELGKYPLFICHFKKVISYWLKILHMDENGYPKRCYLFLLSLDEARKTKGNWATGVKTLLYRYGFKYVWMSQGVGNVSTFLKDFVHVYAGVAFYVEYL